MSAIKEFIDEVRDFIKDQISFVKKSSFLIIILYLFGIFFFFPFIVFVFCAGLAMYLAQYIVEKFNVPSHREDLVTTLLLIIFLIPFFIYIINPMVGYWSSEIWHSNSDGGDDGYHGYGPAIID